MSKVTIKFAIVMCLIGQHHNYFRTSHFYTRSSKTRCTHITWCGWVWALLFIMCVSCCTYFNRSSFACLPGFSWVARIRTAQHRLNRQQHSPHSKSQTPLICTETITISAGNENLIVRYTLVLLGLEKLKYLVFVNLPGYWDIFDPACRC